MSGFWGGVGEFVSGIASPVTTLGGQWLKNRGDISKAAADLKIAELKAKTSIATKRAEMEMKVLDGTQALDYMAVQQQGRTIWDEILSLAILTPMGLSLYGVCAGVPPEMWGYLIVQTLGNQPGWYIVMMFLIFINYFGYRSLFRVFLKAYGSKINPVAFFKKPGKIKPRFSDPKEHQDERNN